MGTTVTIRISGALGAEETDNLTSDLEEAMAGSDWKVQPASPTGALSGVMQVVLEWTLDNAAQVAINAAVLGAAHRVMDRWRSHHVEPTEHTYEIRMGDQVVVRDGAVVDVLPADAEVRPVEDPGDQVGPVATGGDD